MGDDAMTDDTQTTKEAYDISIIRPAMRDEDFKLRGEGFGADRLKAIKKGLLTLHTLELMASTVYKFQITQERSEVNRQLIAAMCNEMGHYQDFQVKLYEYGFKPSKIRWVFWFVGFMIGYGSRLLGKKAIFKVGIFVESKAVSHYAHLLAEIDWDDETRKVVEKDQADEDGHINRWKALLQSA
jgi:ubiquinone biosynthesis monooxygenase Coq7